MSFVRRKISVTFTISEGAFDGTDANIVTVQNLRTSATILKIGGRGMGSLNLRIYGLHASLMNKLSTLGLTPMEQRHNSVSVSAGDDEAGMAIVFIGTIQNGYVDYMGAPEVSFNVQAFSGLEALVKPVQPSSYRGSTDVATIMGNLAAIMNLKFENNGVNVKLAYPYFSGTAREQALDCVEHANIEWNNMDNGVLAIWPKGSSRGGSILEISPETNLVGYPAYTSWGVTITITFNPSINYGSKIKLVSSLLPACGEWVIYRIEYILESETPEGEWFCYLEAARPGYVPLS